jgi:hypothetical protein
MLGYIDEPSRLTPVSDEADVVVAGGGPAGLVAAAAAARNGASTILVERYGFLGGMATAALVGPLAGVRHRYGGGRIVGGIPWELIERLAGHGGALLEPLGYRSGPAEQGDDESPSPARGDVPFDPEILKWTAEAMATEAGVKLRFHCLAVDVLRNGADLVALIVESKSGRQAIRSKVFVDCTGDADLAAWSGAPYEVGRSGDGALQPMSLIFRLSGVDTEALGHELLGSPYIHPALREAAKELSDRGELPVFGGPWTFWGSTIRPGEVMVNMVRLWGDATDSRVLTANEIAARDHIRRFVVFLRKHAPPFQNCVLVDSGAQIGIRETRRIVGEFQLTAEHILQGRGFQDSIGLGGHVIDIHSPAGSRAKPTGSYRQERRRIAPYQIPYRCLLPRKVDNLLVAGRPISATHEAHATLRVMGTAMVTGQAAGTAAALAVSERCHPRRLEPEQLRQRLAEQGVLLDTGVHDYDISGKSAENIIGGKS